MTAPVNPFSFRYALSNFTDKNVMLNWVDSGAMENLFEIRRVEITTNLSPADKNQIFSSSWENNSPSAQPYYNQFDFPKINPNYEGRCSVHHGMFSTINPRQFTIGSIHYRCCTLGQSLEKPRR